MKGREVSVNSNINIFEAVNMFIPLKPMHLSKGYKPVGVKLISEIRMSSL